MILYCKEEECQKAICTTCLKTSHRKHDVTEIEDEQKEILMKSIETFKKSLQNKIQKISTTKEKIQKEADVCIKLMEEKGKVCKIFDKAIEESKKKFEETRTVVKDELNAMNETMILLKDMKISIDNIEDNTYGDIMSQMDTINGIKENIEAHLSGTREYVYHKYLSGPEIGKIVEEKRVIVELTDHSEDGDEYSDCTESDDSGYTDTCDNDDTTLTCEGMLEFSI